MKDKLVEFMDIPCTGAMPVKSVSTETDIQAIQNAIQCSVQELQTSGYGFSYEPAVTIACTARIIEAIERLDTTLNKIYRGMP